jgi:uncharacterized membrane protein YkoI
MRLAPAVIALTFIALGAYAAPASAFSGQKYVQDAKITLPEARTIALKMQKGQITAEELERETGGSGLRYSFDIKSNGVTHEVGVDAKTGKLLENSIEGKNAD